MNHLIKTGALAARKTGHKWLVSAEDVRAYEARRKAYASDAGGSP